MERQKVYVAPSAVVSGDVTMGAWCSVWHGAVVRGDAAPIVLGERTNIQDNAVLHVSTGCPLQLGSDVTVGHGAIVHGCTVGDNTLVGMGSIILDGARIGRDCIVGAGALVTQGAEVPDGCVVVGSPARVARRMRAQDVTANKKNAETYVRHAREALESSSCQKPDSCVSQGPQESPTRGASMIIRRACEDDIPDIQRLLLQVCQVHADGRPDLFQAGGTKYTADELRNLVANNERPIFVAVDETGHVLGYAFCVYEDYRGDTARTPIRTLYIDDICVDEAARGQHVGSAVYEHVITFAREQGFYNVTLNVWSCNPGAQRFYEAMGMTPYKVAMEQVL